MRRLLSVMVSALLVGCGKPPDDSRAKITALEGRFDRLEKQLELGEERLAAIATLQATTQDLQRRLAALEARPPPGPNSPPAAQSAPSPGKPTTPEGAVQPGAGLGGQGWESRRAAMAELNAELQARIAKIREEHGDVPSAQRLQEVREAHRWYRAQLHALLRDQTTAGGGANAPTR
jgi:hypothetical protein